MLVKSNLNIIEALISQALIDLEIIKNLKQLLIE